MHQSFDMTALPRPEEEIYNPYLLKSTAKDQFGKLLKSKTNYSFGGRTPIQEKRKYSEYGPN